MKEKGTVLFGIYYYDGSVIEEKDFDICTLSAIIETKGEVPGERIELSDNMCTSNLPDIDMEPGPERVDVVIGDPRLFRGVQVIERGFFENLEKIPEKIRDFFYEDDDMIIFEDRKGNRIFALIQDTTLLSIAEPYIVPQ